MPSKSKSQQRFMGMVRAAQKGELKNPSKSVKKAAKSMDKDDVDDFASTKHKGLPNKVKREQRVRELIKKMVREMMDESTVRLSQHKDADFEPGQFVKLIGKKGWVKLDKKSVKQLAKTVRNLAGKFGMGWSFTEGKLNEMQTKHKNFFLDQIQKDTISLKNQIAYTKDALKHKLEKWERKEYSEVLKKLQKDLKEMIAREKRVKKWEVSDLPEGKLNEAKTITLPNGVKVKIDFKGLTFKSRHGKDVFLDRDEMKKFFSATTKYLRYENIEEDFAGAYPKEMRKKFDKKRQKQSEVLGYKLTGKSDIKTEIDDATVHEAKERNYKEEYKKYGSSKKAKKYRAELNAYNRKKGTYGNGDGKDASHKGGKIVGFEAESKNRGRAEKSRLKKEGKLTEATDSYVVWSPLLNKVYDGPVSEKEALKLVKKYSKQGQYHVGMQGTKYYNKTKLGKKNPIKEGFDLKKLEIVIKSIQKKIAKQGRVTNARDEEHLKQLIKVYKDMGGRKIKEGKLNEKMDRKKAAILLKQLGGNRFIAMTGAKGFAFSNKYMSFKIGRNSKGINFVRIGHNAKDLYDMEFGFVSTRGIKVKKKVKDVYADMLGTIFTKYTGMHVRL